jgi:ZIP family zinc transporter
VGQGPNLGPADLLLVGLGSATCAATLLGGAFAIAFRRLIHLILGLSAGAVIGVALLELLPEALTVGFPAYSFTAIAGFIGLGFMAYMAVDRALAIIVGEQSRQQAHLGAGSLTLHSLFDGLAIGLAFQASAVIGAVVAAAVIAHDISDGVNTVNLSLVGSGDVKTARRWLVADAVAPLIGIFATRLLVLPKSALGVLLAVFAGAFLYIGAGKLIGESHRRHPHAWTTIAALLGFSFIYGVTRAARMYG